MEQNEEKKTYKSEFVHIEPVNPMMLNQIVQGSFVKGVNLKILTSKNTMVEEPTNLPPGKKNSPSWDIIFKNDLIKGQFKLRETYEISGDPNAPKELKDNKFIIETFWLNHIGALKNAELARDKDGKLLKPIGEDNGWIKGVTKIPQFNIVFEKQKKEKEIDDSKDRMDVMNHLYSMTIEGLRSAMFWFQQHPHELTKEEMIIELVGKDWHSGIIYANKSIGGNKHLQEFKRIFMNSDTSDHASYMLCIRKAIQYKFIVQQKNGKGGVTYTYGENPISTTENGLISYFRDQPELYAELLNRVDISDGKLTVDDSKSVVVHHPDEMNTVEDVKSALRALHRQNAITEEEYRKIPTSFKVGTDAFHRVRNQVKEWQKRPVPETQE